MAQVVGLMSGTSLDGVDAVICDIRRSSKGVLQPTIKIKSHCSATYPRNLQERLLSTGSGDTDTQKLCELNMEVGRVFAKCALKAIQNVDGRVACIGSHGQTVWHQPDKGATLQIGAPSVIAAATGVKTWSDFRSADMAIGGEGAPLAPIVHLPLFGHKMLNVAVVNIGGIANITHIPAGAVDLQSLMAYDTGPGCMLIDTLVREFGKGNFDRNGAIAAKGVVDARLLDKCLRHPYFKKRAPKSTGREMFGDSFLQWVNIHAGKADDSDIIATVTELTAATIVNEIKKMEKAGKPTDRLVICGGGAKNHHLLQRIKALCGAEMEVVTSDGLGVPCKLVEPVLIALLAWFAENGIRQNLSSITGSKGSILMGALTPV